MWNYGRQERLKGEGGGGKVAQASVKSVIIKFSVDPLKKKAERSESDFWELMGGEPAV